MLACCMYTVVKDKNYNGELEKTKDLRKGRATPNKSS